MKKTKILKFGFSCFLAMCLSFGTPLSLFVSASNAVDVYTPKGDCVSFSEITSLAEQLKESLLKAESTEKRQLILQKASLFGLNEIDFDGVYLTEKEKSILSGETESEYFSKKQNKSIVNAPTNIASRTVVAGVNMPDYALAPIIYKQEKRDWCSAGTIQTVLNYVGATSPTQQTIMNAWQSNWNVTYPDLPLIRNYINPRLPSNYGDYATVVYAGNQEIFNSALQFDVLQYQPTIIHMGNNTTSTANWPYKTAGHFCICNGLLTWENNKYFMGDPYYFSTYVSGAGNVGTHNRTWSQLNTVITNKFGSGSQMILF